MDIRTGSLLFMEGILAFISPCFLPMIPIYLSYLVGKKEVDRKSLLTNGLGFIAGFTLIFVILGMSAAVFSKYLLDHRLTIQRIGGVILVILGLNMTGLIKIPFLMRDFRMSQRKNAGTFLDAFIFGMIIAFGWSPCLGSFLSAALLTAGNAGTIYLGGLMLFIFSMGLGVPFMITALLIDSMSGIFAGIKKNYNIISIISGIFLMIMGILMIADKFLIYSSMFY